MKDRRIATLADVARRAQVSTATVSRCLNETGRVSRDARARVMEAVRELGYSPNFNARALAARRTNTVGAVIPTMDNAIFSRGLQAFQEELHRKGLTLLVASSQYDMHTEEEQIRTLVARGADALLLIGYDRTPGIYRFLEERGVARLIAWAHDPASREVAIGFDNRAAMQALAARVIALGHRRLAFISAERRNNDRARERVEGVRAAMAAGGLDPATLEVVETPYAIENGARACDALLSRPVRPSAIMCGNDVLAAGAVRAALKAGLRVPRDVSITGFDDIELASVITPALTTVHVPHRQMGRDAARILVSMLADGTDGVLGRRLETTLCLRETLAAPQDETD